MTTEHRTCIKVNYIPEVAATFDTSTEFTETQDYLLDLFKMNENNKSDIRSKSKAVDLQAKRAKLQMKNLRTEVNELFDRLEKKIDKSVDDIKSRDDTGLSELANATDTISADLQNYMSDIQTKVNERKSCQLFIATKCMKESIVKIAKEIKRVAENESIQRYHFEPEPKIAEMKQNIAKLGTLKLLNKRAKFSEFEIDIDVKTEDEDKTCNITGMSLLSESKLVVVNNSNLSVKLLDIEKNVITSTYKTGKDYTSMPFDVTQVTKAEIAVTYPNVKTIHFISISDVCKLKFERNIDATGLCHGIKRSGDNLIVSFNSPAVVKILSMNGKVFRTISNNFEYPDYVSVNHEGNLIYISNWSMHIGSFTRITNEEKLKADIKRFEIGRPSGSFVHRNGSVFVCCANMNLILQLSEGCEKIHNLLNKSDGIIDPRCIVVSEHNRLFIGMRHDKVKCFKLC